MTTLCLADLRPANQPLPAAAEVVMRAPTYTGADAQVYRDTADFCRGLLDRIDERFAGRRCAQHDKARAQVLAAIGELEDAAAAVEQAAKAEAPTA